MRIFIAGATGAIGLPVVSRLAKEGHQVFGFCHSDEKKRLLLERGATPLAGDALDPASIAHALDQAAPEVVIEMLTALPKEYTPQSMREASERDKTLRIIGGNNLQKAAEEREVRRYIIQSSAFWYEPGEGLADEQTLFAFQASPAVSAGSKIYQMIEQRVLHSNRLEAVCLRFGFFYGPGTWFAKGASMARRVMERDFPIVGDGKGIWNFVHIEDAAAGVAASVSGPAGIYNLTDGTPAYMKVWLPAYARWLGAPEPSLRTAEAELRLNGPDSLYYATQLRGASNQKARQLLGFSPRPLEWLSTAPDVLST